ncbi:MAG TPA: VOC family protein [Nevskiaceae bacterium]|nr:VOC family protein [Nevskiaceae bacterium]
MSTAARRVVPTKIAHFVIRCRDFAAMLKWYRTVFHMRTSFEAPVIAFLTFDDEEHHRVAFLNTAHMPGPDGMRTGIDHVAFTYGSLEELLHTWERLKAEGITPFWCINHGMTTSMYYADPDGNELELQVENFATQAEGLAWFSSPQFAANPLGIDYDPQVLLDKLRAGVPEAELLRQDAAPVPPEKAYRFTKLPPPPG